MRGALILLASIPAVTWAQPPAALEETASPANQLASALSQLALDPEQAYLVRDLSLIKDDIKLYFNNGHLIFSKPIAGERLAAIFAGDAEADGEVLLLPPRRSERESLAKYTGSPNLNEHFNTALLIFSDGTGQSLLEEIAAGGRGRPIPELGPSLSERWGSVVRNLAGSFVQRLTVDLLSPVRAGGGFLFMALSGRRLGNFDVLYDPLADDQIMMGRLNDRGNALVYDVWTSFPSRAIRQGSAQPVEPPFDVGHYSINAFVDTDLWLKATTRADITVGPNPARAMMFGISHAERITAVRVDGVPAETVFRESLRDRALRPDENDVFLAIAPETLAPGSKHQIEFEHEGAVIADRGNDVYAVGARANWYPRSKVEFALYDIEFRYPRALTLVSAGEVIDDREDGAWRVTHRRTVTPIRVAGFNLGNYAKASSEAQGLQVNVYGNRGLDPALRPKPRETVILQRPRTVFRPGYPPRPVEPTVTTIMQTPPPPDPLGRLGAVAKDVSDSLEYFSGIYGSPALRSLTVAPMPGTAGQGFPGLIYLSTLTYLNASDRPEHARNARQQTFFSDLMAAHEVAHQWWGNLVTTDGYRDEWIMEALANYSSMLWLEKRRGRAALEQVLADFRADLLAESADGGSLESFGPLTWGYRLESAKDPETWRAITYEKGAWVMHMMRKRLGDPAFFAMLKELRSRFEYKSVSTEDLQGLMQEFLPGRGDSQAAEIFFDTWVYSTGIPAAVRVRTSASGRPPSVRLSGAVEQRGAPEGFSAEVPVEIQLPTGDPRIIWVRTGDGPSPFTVTLPQAPKSVAIPSNAVLSGTR